MQMFTLAYEFVKLDCVFPGGVGSRHQEGVCHHSSMDSAAGQMAVCIPMVMLGYFQPNGTIVTAGRNHRNIVGGYDFIACHV